MEIIPKESQKTSKGLNFLFYFSLIILLFSIVGFFVLDHFLKQAEKDHSSLTAVLTKEIEEKNVLGQKIFNYKKKADSFYLLTNQQLKNSKLFTNFEKIVHPQVWFSDFNLNARERIIILSGLAQNFEALEEQVSVIRNANWIKDFKLERVSMSEEGKIDFGLTIFFKF